MEEHPKLLWLLRGILICLALLTGLLLLVNLPMLSGQANKLTQVVSSILYGLVYAYLLNPFVRWVDKLLLPRLQKTKLQGDKARRLSRLVGILFAFCMAGLFIYLLIKLIVPQVGASIMGIAKQLPDYYASIEKFVGRLVEDNPQIVQYVNIALENGYGHLENFIQNDLVGRMQSLLLTLTSSVYSVLRELINMVIGIVVAIYALWAKDRFLSQAKKLTVALWSPDRADRLMEQARKVDKIFNGFIIGKIIDSLIIGVLCYIGVSILKLPYAVLVSTIVGVTNVIPYFGPIIGAIPCTLLILLNSPLQGLYFVIFVLVLQQIDGNIIGPKILGDNVGISGFWILVSITVGGGLFGFPGMLLGVPVFATLYMLISDYTERALRKQGKPIQTKAYFSIRQVADLPAGETGELVLTTLTKEGIPLIRYRTRDITSLDYTPCRCGRTHVRLTRIKGRSDDMLIIRGVNVFPQQIESILMESEGLTPNYQLVVDRVHNLDTLEVQVEVDEALFADEIRKLQSLEGRIQKTIKEFLGVSTKVRLMEPHSLDRSEGKAKRIIDKRLKK